MANKPVKRIKLDKKGKKTSEKVVSATKAEGKVSNDKKNSTKKKTPKIAKTAIKPATGLFGYIKGSWQELKQVRWPNRRATWGLTIAVILYTIFFLIIILLFDAAFQQLFKEVILK
jgi:preprotein translocase SecE subunit